MPLYQGPHQIGSCQRCGWKLQRRALTEDGRLRNLLVCATCWDPDHPQDYPAPPRPEGLPPWKPSIIGSVLSPPVLTATAIGPAEADLSWTDADGGGALISWYQVWRSTDGGDSSLLIQLPVERDSYTNQTSDNEYEDDSVDLSNHYYTYYIIAVNADGESVQSLPQEVNLPVVIGAEVRMMSAYPGVKQRLWGTFDDNILANARRGTHTAPSAPDASINSFYDIVWLDTGVWASLIAYDVGFIYGLKFNADGSGTPTQYVNAVRGWMRAAPTNTGAPVIAISQIGVS